ncbi:MAG: leucine--tRNA ligase [Prevotella sp.]|nr:leucine--tRNA ligase [Prevotella sp.]
MEYNFRDIEKKWQQRWVENQTYRVVEDPEKKKFYVLNMFPYPSGAGLHVGHPLGYIASDIYARFKRQQGFNVLNPMGYDAYGLPAEQYAIQTGQHPEKTTFENIDRYRSQLDKIGFCFDWSREVRTCEPDYYKWTQWAFQKMYNSYFDEELQKAQPIEKLIEKFKAEGTWPADEKAQGELLMEHRIAYLGETMVNWCAELGTVLANDEVVDGVSVRGGYPVVQKLMQQWCLRVSAYAQRLLDGLDTIDWTESLKETQRNWIGRSEGTEMEFRIANSEKHFTIFTTRADTIFGVTFMVLAPESELVAQLTTPEQKQAVDEYLAYVKKRTERERQMDHRVTGVFSGSYAINPLTGKEIPIWIAEYVLAGYGTGAIMAVPAHDSRDYAFAKHFNLPIIPLIEGADVSEESFDAKEGVMCNSSNGEFSLNGLTVKEAIQKTKEYVTEKGLGQVKVNYRLRDAIFSRQRYWGEPFPVYYKDGMPYMIPEECLPLELPEVKTYQPTATGEPPLGNAQKWAWNVETNEVVDKSLIDNVTIFPLELCTMPGFAGSSAYYLRYMDPKNDQALISDEAAEYWKNVDLYVGGSEHATGHLIYARFWNKFLYDLGVSRVEEPFQKLINQGMIQGRSNFVYRVNKAPLSSPEGDTNVPLEMNDAPVFVSFGQKDNYNVTPIHVDVNIVKNDILDIEAFKAWRPEYENATFIFEDGSHSSPSGESEGGSHYICGWAIEKMSKSMFNVVNPDMIVEKYGADTLRLYEMFLGPVEQSKPWDTNGIDGCHRFLKKFWNLVAPLSSPEGDTNVQQNGNEAPSGAVGGAELKSLHKLIKKVTQDIEMFSYNTSISAFMICVNELSQLKCKNRDVMRTLVTLIAPFAPHIAEELWEMLGGKGSVCDSPWPKWNEEYLVENSVRLGVAFNGKTRFDMEFAADAANDVIEKAVFADERTAKYIENQEVLKVIIVPKRMVNVVLK